MENDRFIYGLPRDTPRKSYKAIYGSLQAINKAIAEGKPIFIPEGEKDADTLIKQGYTAFAYGGVALTRKTIENFLGVEIDRYVQVDFEGFADIIDALGRRGL